MSIDLVLDQPIGAAKPIRIGPFDRIRVGHRRISAGSTKIIRKMDGAWHMGDTAYLEARVEPSGPDAGKLVQVKFTRPWAGASPSSRSRSVRLYGSRLLGDGRWVGSNDDDAGTWVSEDTGRANDGLLITAA